MPSEPSRRINASASARKRCAGTMIGTRSGIGSSGPTRTWRSSTMRPFSMSGIDAVPEWFDAGALERIDKQLIAARAQRQIGGGDVLDHVGDLGVGHSRADQRAELGMIVGLA